MSFSALRRYLLIKPYAAQYQSQRAILIAHGVVEPHAHFVSCRNAQNRMSPCVAELPIAFALCNFFALRLHYML